MLFECVFSKLYGSIFANEGDLENFEKIFDQSGLWIKKVCFESSSGQVADRGYGAVFVPVYVLIVILL